MENENKSNSKANVQVGITDHLDPEVQAMVMAMYSRSYAPITSRIPDSAESVTEHKEKLGRFYVNYGHKSVGQLGSSTIWLEGISQLAAKAVENNELFNGQESSTRYIDYSNQPMISFNKESQEWQEKFRAFYIRAIPLVIEKLKGEFPFGSNTDCKGTSEEEMKKETVWTNTIKARAFDICRGFLPAGCTTNVAFTGTFDVINDHFGEMLYHPSIEMRDLAVDTLYKLKEKYPFGTMDIPKLRVRYSYVDDDYFYNRLNYVDDSSIVFSYTPDFYYDPFFSTREKFEKIDRHNASQTIVEMKGQLDFGSYRDLQRHRKGVISMEILGVSYGFHDFYRDNLPNELKEDLDILLSSYHHWYINDDKLTSVQKQYCTPMGYKVGVRYTCDINQFLYIAELRTGKTVHQTLRHLVQSWVKVFKESFETVNGPILIHADMDIDNFTMKRGTQTFLE